MQLDDLRRYLSFQSEIPGWFDREAAQLFAWLDAIQRRLGVSGDLFEIGVHHGKSAILLGMMADPARERLGVCDLFAAQEENKTRSGAGSEAEFLKNFQARVGRTDFLSIHKKNSKSLAPEETGRDRRFFHIDGGHGADEALSDLRLANASCSAMGIVMIDDYFNLAWPGVSEAVCRFMIESPGALAPLAAGFNKLAFCRPAAHAAYLESLQADGWRDYLSEPKLAFKRSEFFGFEMVSYFIPFAPAAPPERMLQRIVRRARGRSR